MGNRRITDSPGGIQATEVVVGTDNNGIIVSNGNGSDSGLEHGNPFV